MATLGKRTRSHTASNPSIKSRPTSPSPPSKRLKTKAVVVQLAGDDSNKENICPEGWYGDVSTRSNDDTDDEEDVDENESTTRASSRRRTRSISATGGRVNREVSRTPVKTRLIHQVLTPPPTPPTDTVDSDPFSESSQTSSSTSPPPPAAQTPPHTPVTSHGRAKALLRLSLSVSEGTITGRDSERASILSFLYPFLRDESTEKGTNSMYISGSPGTGKTFLVSDILRSLSSEYPELTTAYVNCMGLNEQNLWERVLEALQKEVAQKPRKGKGKKEDAAGRLKALLRDEKKCILVLDELDTLPQQLRQTLFALPTTFPNTLRLIGISNDLTIAPPSTTTLHFVPYNPEQIVDIVKSKLGEETSKVVQPQALILLAKKIAASTGDMRAAMQVLSRALDKLPQNAGETSPLGMKDMLDALRRCTTSSASSTGSATSAVVRDLGLQARLVLVAILVARRRLGADLSLTFASLSSPSKGSKVVEQMTPSRLFTLYSAILTSPPSSYTQTTSSSFSPVSRNEFTDLIGVLETSSIVTLNLCSSPSRGKGRGGKNAAAESTLELAESVREEEVLKGLVSGADGKSGVKEDEIKRLWEGELWRLGNELRAKGRQAEAANPQVLGFD